jgi:hypothetical protein
MSDKLLRDFGPDDVMEWRDSSLTKVSRATVNREMNLLSAVFADAIKELRFPIATQPVRMVSRPKKTPPAPVAALTPAPAGLRGRPFTFDGAPVCIVARGGKSWFVATA